MVIKWETFFQKGFWKSKSDSSYCGVFILGKVENGIPTLSFYYINSWLKFKPCCVIKNFECFYSDVKYQRNVKNGKMSLSFKENGGMDFSFQENNTSYDFQLDLKDVLLFQQYMFYLNSFLGNYDEIKKIVDLNNLLDSKISNEIEWTINLKDYNSLIYRGNKIVDRNWEIKDIYIPTIEESFHVMKDSKSTGYYFKFFSEYLTSIRNLWKDEDSNISWFEYPFQLVVQGGDSSSEVFTFSEFEFLVLLNFMKSPKNLLDSKLGRVLIEEGILHTEVQCSITITNHNKWKVYVNKDVLPERTYEKLKKLHECWDYNTLFKEVDYLRKTKVLITNKFVAFDMMKDIIFQKSEFVNLKYARSTQWVIDSKSSIFQVGNLVWWDDFTINLIKWDIQNWWKKFATAPIQGDKLSSFLYKLNQIRSFLQNPLLYYKSILLNNIETIRFFPLEWIQDFYEENRSAFYPFISKKDNSFLRKTSLEFGSLNIFTPNIPKKLNNSIFTLKRLPWLGDDRYPITLVIDLEDGQKASMTLSVGQIFEIAKRLKEKGDYEMVGKTKSWKFKKFKIVHKDSESMVMYWESSSHNFVNPKILLKIKIDSQRLLDDFSNGCVLLSDYEWIYNRAILYSKNKQSDEKK